MRLDPKKGGKVFDGAKDAVDQLLKVKAADVATEIDGLVDVDQQLAKRAIDDVPGTAANSKNEANRSRELSAANAELAKGVGSSGKPKDAIDHYKRAWEHAQNAIEAANKT